LKWQLEEEKRSKNFWVFIQLVSFFLLPPIESLPLHEPELYVVFILEKRRTTDNAIASGNNKKREKRRARFTVYLRGCQRRAERQLSS